jgi:hypothetical protein
MKANLTNSQSDCFIPRFSLTFFSLISLFSVSIGIHYITKFAQMQEKLNSVRITGEAAEYCGVLSAV